MIWVPVPSGHGRAETYGPPEAQVPVSIRLESSTTLRARQPRARRKARAWSGFMAGILDRGGPAVSVSLVSIWARLGLDFKADVRPRQAASVRSAGRRPRGAAHAPGRGGAAGAAQ